MKFFAISNPGVSKFLFDEVSEFGLNSKVRAVCFSEISLQRDACLFSSEAKDCLKFLRKSQLALSMNLQLWSGKDLEKFDPISIHAFDDFLDLGNGKSKISLSVTVEGVRGNENRISICGKVSQKIRDLLKEKCGVESEISYKNPQYKFVIYYAGEDYNGEEGSKLNGEFLFGLRLHTQDLDSRDYRVFHHKAGYKGDFASAFLRILGVQNKSSYSKLLVCKGRDGVFAIEAAMLLSRVFVRELDENLLEKIPFFSEFLEDKENSSEKGDAKEKVEEFVDKKITFVSSASPNVRSTRSNAEVAKVLNLIDLKKMPLDEYAFTLGSDVFNLAIVRLTKKDERNLNELYYQLSEVMVKAGKAILIFRSTLEISVSERFEELKRGVLLRGQGEHGYVLISLKD